MSLDSMIYNLNDGDLKITIFKAWCFMYQFMAFVLTVHKGIKELS